MDNIQVSGDAPKEKSALQTYGTIIALLAALVVLLVGAAFLITNFPKSMGSPMDRGLRCLQDKEYTQAVAAFREAIQQNPQNVKAYEGIVSAYEGQGDEIAALHMLEKGYEKTGDETLGSRMEAMRDSMGPIITGSSATPDPDSPVGEGETARQRQVALLQEAYELLSKKDYDGMCSVDGSDEADLVISELRGDHVIYIPEDGNHGTGTGCGVYQVSGGYFFYYGDFVDGERLGHGVSYWYNGSGYEIYDGEWKNDKPNGYGTSSLVYFYGEEEHRTGNFVDGLEDGDFVIEKKDGYSNTVLTGEYSVVYGRPTEATERLEEIVQEVEAKEAAGEPVDQMLQGLYDAYDNAQTYLDETIYLIFDDYTYMTYYRYGDLLGALGYR